MIEPLRLSYTVECPAVEAFDIWARRFSTWWPKSHSASGDSDASFFLEPSLGGRIYERTGQGIELDWGEITIWDPPVRLGYLWHLRRDRSDATDVLITFVDMGNGSTRLDIVHSGWERLGAGREKWRDANKGGWDSLLPHFLGTISQQKEQAK